MRKSWSKRGNKKGKDGRYGKRGGWYGIDNGRMMGKCNGGFENSQKYMWYGRK